MWDVLVRREVRPAIDALKGKKTGYAETYAQLDDEISGAVANATYRSGRSAESRAT